MVSDARAGFGNELLGIAKRMLERGEMADAVRLAEVAGVLEGLALGEREAALTAASRAGVGIGRSEARVSGAEVHGSRAGAVSSG